MSRFATAALAALIAVPAAQGQTEPAQTKVSNERLAEIFAGDEPKSIPEIKALQAHVQGGVGRGNGWGFPMTMTCWGPSFGWAPLKS